MTELFSKCMNNIRKMPFLATIIDKLYCSMELAPAYRQPAALPGQRLVCVRGCVGISIELKALPTDGRLVVRFAGIYRTWDIAAWSARNRAKT